VVKIIIQTVDFLQINPSSPPNEHLGRQLVAPGHGQVEWCPVGRVHCVDPGAPLQQNLGHVGEAAGAGGVQGAALVGASRFGVRAARQQQGHRANVAPRRGQQQGLHVVAVTGVRLAT